MTGTQKKRQRHTAAERHALVNFARNNPNAPIPSEAHAIRVTNKQDRFSRNVAMGMTLVDSYIDAFDTKAQKHSSQNGLYVAAYEVSVKPQVALRIAQYVQKFERENSALTETRQARILKTLEEILGTGQSDQSRLRAAELLGRASGLFEKAKDGEGDKAESLDDLEKRLKAIIANKV